MLNKISYLMLGVFVLYIQESSYAVVNKRQLEIPCQTAKTHTPSKLTIPGDPKTQYSLIFDGIWAEGYTDGLITASAARMDVNIFRSLSIHNREILKGTRINIEATCSGSKKVGKFRIAGDSLTCEKGEELLIKLYDPECDGTQVNKRGILTLIEIQEDKEELANQQLSIPITMAEPEIPDSIVVTETATQPSMAAATMPVYNRTAPIAPPQPLPPPAAAAAPLYNRTAPIDHLKPLILGEVQETVVGSGDAPQPSALADTGFEYVNATGPIPNQPPVAAAIPTYDRTVSVVPLSYVSIAPQPSAPSDCGTNIPQFINVTGSVAPQPNPTGVTAWHVYRHVAEPAAPQQPGLVPDLRGVSITPQQDFTDLRHAYIGGCRS